MPDEEFVLSIYRPVSGWKAVLYGPEGPERTSFFVYDTPHEALADAQDWSKAEDIPLNITSDDITICPICGGWMVKLFCGSCAEHALRNHFG